MFSWYKYLIVSLIFSRLAFWSGNLFLIAPFPDRREIKTDIRKQHELYVNNLVGDVLANPSKIDFYRYINSQKKMFRISPL